MKLFVKGPCGHKIPIKSEAKLRSDLPPIFQAVCPQDQVTYTFTAMQVEAESSGGGAGAGAVIGGLLGMLVGPEGALAGVVLGGVLGAGADKTEQDAVRRFNAS